MRRLFTPLLETVQRALSSSDLFQRWSRYLYSSVVGMACVLGAGVAGQAAETVSAQYSQLELELSVSELQAYAELGQKSPLVETLDLLLEQDQRAQVQGVLTRPFDIAPAVLARFFSTPSGYRVLEDLSEIIQAKSDSVDSVLALRTAFILAASQDESLTLLSLLKAFPDRGVRLDLERGARIFEQLDAQFQSHQEAIAAIKQRSSKQSEPLSRGFAYKFSRPGPFAWEQESLNLRDERSVRLRVSGQPRSFPLDLYLPKRSGAAPLVILSHGLGSGRTAYQYFAEHLASYGYAVAVPEHPGSSFRQWQALLTNQAKVISQPQEVLNRPLDIQYLLDVLTDKNQNDPRLAARLDLDRVGMFGHSYGGYTALAIAGAKLNPQALRETCQQNLVAVFNPSLLLQCQADQLPEVMPDLSDARVKAVFVTHPIVSTLLGQEGLASVRVPVTLLAGGADRIAPLVPEQMNPYKTLTAAKDRTFILVERADHFSQVGEIADQETVFGPTEEAVDPIILKSREVIKSLGLAFFQTRLNSTDRPDLSLLTLVRSLNEPQFPVYGVVGFEKTWARTWGTDDRRNQPKQ